MLTSTLRECDQRILTRQCCKTDGSACNCIDELTEDYYHRPDSYNCTKKMNTYVLKYGPSYASEIYHYLVASNFNQKFNQNHPINIMSLGCGFSPDFFSIKEYFSDYGNSNNINYIGIDNSTCWDEVRPNTNECNYIHGDLTNPFSLKDIDVVFICKVFSTLYKNDLEDSFLANLKAAITNDLNPGAIVVFIDVNNRRMGRDCFHNNVSRYMPNFSQYYLTSGYGSCYSETNWTHINHQNLVFSIPRDLSVEPIDHTNKTIIFEYRK